MLGLLLGTAVVAWVLPAGQPPRRAAFGVDDAVLGAFAFAGGFWLWSRFFEPARFAASAQDRFLLLWLAGLLLFSSVLNWHVNAADALLAAPPALLLLFRDARLRPSRRAVGVWLALSLPFGWLLAAADAEQADVYRAAARRIAGEIGAQPGGRWFVGHWGLQHYLEREGFQSVVPPMYGRSDLAVGDWVATARNVSQIDVSQNMRRFTLQRSLGLGFRQPLPLRTTNADAGAGFYSHHAGYLPFAFSTRPLDRVQLGARVGARLGAGLAGRGDVGVSPRLRRCKRSGEATGGGLRRMARPSLLVIAWRDSLGGRRASGPGPLRLRLISPPPTPRRLPRMHRHVGSGS